MNHRIVNESRVFVCRQWYWIDRHFRAPIVTRIRFSRTTIARIDTFALIERVLDSLAILRIRRSIFSYFVRFVSVFVYQRELDSKQLCVFLFAYNIFDECKQASMITDNILNMRCFINKQEVQLHLHGKRYAIPTLHYLFLVNRD